MTINQEMVSAYKECLANPKKHNLSFPSLREIFLPSDIAVAKHIVFEKYQIIIGREIPKLIFYIILDEVFPQKKADDGNLGWCLEFEAINSSK
ncbi:hypothetical protein [Chryseobacterium indologenes]|uniref:Uncharacterized protein n=1 Tax=Chryseobacterium indologenes TaxID=253 RepID=A0A0N1KRZ7_CHRID|nr:hypothetical protein [Chryseobacterium indologenes]KPE51259.1 hypothetical protein AOB46_11390 [Chryseobacterium indologenes]